jgi:hypothetical protein
VGPSLLRRCLAGVNDELGCRSRLDLTISTATCVSSPSTATASVTSVPRIAAMVLPVENRVVRSLKRTTWAHSRPKKTETLRSVAVSLICTRESGPIRSTVPSALKRTVARPSLVTMMSSSASAAGGDSSSARPSRTIVTRPRAASSVANGWLPTVAACVHERRDQRTAGSERHDRQAESDNPGNHWEPVDSHGAVGLDHGASPPPRNHPTDHAGAGCRPTHASGLGTR